MSWMYRLFSEPGVSKLIGMIEIITGILLILYAVSAKPGFIGGVLSSATFILTISFLFTTPGSFTKIDGIWLPDAFILKDLMALGISIYITALSAKELHWLGNNQA
jgi:reactive chlorine resistance protein C